MLLQRGGKSALQIVERLDRTVHQFEAEPGGRISQCAGFQRAKSALGGPYHSKPRQIRDKVVEKTDALLRQRFLAADRIHDVSRGDAARPHIAFGESRLDGVGSIGGKHQRLFGKDFMDRICRAG